MDLRHPARLLLVVATALHPALAAALDGTFVGALEPDNHGPKIPIVVEMKDLGIMLEGSVKTSGTYKGSGAIVRGENSYGQCTVNVDLSPTLGLRMSGSCDLVSYAGNYILVDKQARARGFGTFNLPRKATEAFKAEPTRAPVTTASCLKANTQCLLGCPRTDEGAEFVCSNRCRTKLNACKERVKKATTTLPETTE